MGGRKLTKGEKMLPQLLQPVSYVGWSVDSTDSPKGDWAGTVTGLQAPPTPHQKTKQNCSSHRFLKQYTQLEPRRLHHGEGWGDHMAEGSFITNVGTN